MNDYIKHQDLQEEIRGLYSDFSVYVEECSRTNTETVLYGPENDKTVQELNDYRLKKNLGH